MKILKKIEDYKLVSRRIKSVEKHIEENNIKINKNPRLKQLVNNTRLDSRLPDKLNMLKSQQYELECESFIIHILATLKLI
jgi:type III secretion system FlhB-like substrate exporter